MKDMSISKTFQTGYLSQTAEMMRKLNCNIRRNGDNYKYTSMYEVVAVEGTAYANAPLTGQEEDILRKVLKLHLKHYRPRQRECYANAYYLAGTAERLGVPIRYAEGYGLHVIAANHAWCVLNGKPIDVTWREKVDDARYSLSGVMERIRWNIGNCGYVGFEVPMHYLNLFRAKHLYHGSVLDNWKDGWPIVKDGLAALTT